MIDISEFAREGWDFCIDWTPYDGFRVFMRRWPAQYTGFWAHDSLDVAIETALENIESQPA